MGKFKIGDIVTHKHFTQSVFFVAGVSEIDEEQPRNNKYECRQEVNGILYTTYLYEDELLVFDQKEQKKIAILPK